MRRHSIFALLLALAPLGGCTAVISAARISGAQTAFEGARRTDAERTHPYEYTTAQLYLAKAREEDAYGHYGAAIELAAKAEEWALEAQAEDAAAAAAKPARKAAASDKRAKSNSAAAAGDAADDAASSGDEGSSDADGEGDQ